MHKTTLEAVGLRTKFDIPAGILFSGSFEPERFGLKVEDKHTIGILLDFVAEYNREIPTDTRRPVLTSRRAAEALYPVLRSLDHEEIWCLFLSKGNLPISRHLITTGSLEGSVIDTQKIIKMALVDNAWNVILFHNNPSGNPRPSQSDIRETGSRQVGGRPGGFCLPQRYTYPPYLHRKGFRCGPEPGTSGSDRVPGVL